MGGFRAAGVRFNYRGRAAFVEIRLSRDAGETRARERFPTLSPSPLLQLDYSRPKKTLESFAGKIRKIYNGHRSREIDHDLRLIAPERACNRHVNVVFIPRVLREILTPISEKPNPSISSSSSRSRHQSTYVNSATSRLSNTRQDDDQRSVASQLIDEAE